MESLQDGIKSVLIEIWTPQTILPEFFLQYISVAAVVTLTVLTIMFTFCLVYLIVTIFKYMYWLFWETMDITRKENTIGFVHHDQRMKNGEEVHRKLKQKVIGDTPPVYPNGWFAVMESNDIEVGQVKGSFAFGQPITLFRNKRGIVRVVDSYCPHLGANLSAGGKVVDDDCIECPFHGWKFDGESGKVVDIPYSKKNLDFVSLKTWHSCEENGFIFVWYHCDGDEPSWQMCKAARLPELKYVGRTEHIVNCHIQDIPENAADVAHLHHLHKPVLGGDIEKPDESFINNALNHDIKVSWYANDNPGMKHLAHMHIDDLIQGEYKGLQQSILRLKFNVLQVGPGAVHIELDNSLFRGLIVQNVTPLGPLKQKLLHQFYISWHIPMVFAKAFYYLETVQIERDMVMWNNKTYLQHPIYCKEESALVKHRRWYSRFYSENSPKLEDVIKEKQDINDW